MSLNSCQLRFLVVILRFLIAVCVSEWMVFITSREQSKTDVKVWKFYELILIHQIPLKTVKRSKLVGKADYLLTLSSSYSSFK